MDLETEALYNLGSGSWLGEVVKTTVIFVKFLCDVASRKFSKSTNVAQSYSESKNGTYFWDSVHSYINKPFNLWIIPGKKMLQQNNGN